MMRICTVMISAFIIISCSEKKPQQKQLVEIYKNILITRAEYPDTAESNPIIRDMMKKKGYTNETFFKAMEELAGNKPDFIQFMDSLRGSLDKEIKNLETTPVQK